MSKPDPKTEPMDAKIKEVQNPTPATNNQRVCWALKTLVAEFLELFPETPVEYSNYDGRNTALDATFDMTVMSGTDDELMATALLRLLVSDERVATVLAEDSAMLVGVRPGPRTQDSREPFNLNDAFMVLIEADEREDADLPEWDAPNTPVAPDTWVDKHGIDGGM